MTVERAGLGDIDAIMALEELGFAEGTRERRDVFLDRLRVFPEGFFLARVDENPHGAAAYLCAWLRDSAEPLDAKAFALDVPLSGKHVPDGDEIYLASLVVDPVVRGRGVARTLIETAIERLSADRPRIRGALLLVNEAWENAARLYAVMGFSEVGVLPGFFDGSSDGILMRRLWRRLRRRL